jgi:hypothetical protein
MHAKGICLFVRQHRNLESVLDRGDKLDDLVNKSEELSDASKLFYTTVSFNISLNITRTIVVASCQQCDQ